MASRAFGTVGYPVWRFLRGSAVLHAAGRGFSVSRRCPSAHTLKRDGEASPWRLHGAVCVERLPVTSQDQSPVERRFLELMQQMELERSLFSDHELRLQQDAVRMGRRQEDDYDSDEEEEERGQEIVMAQDLEDAWEQKLRQFQPADRIKATDQTDFSSPERCLGDSLVLLARQAVGSQPVWCLPQAQWQGGETLRQTAERALTCLPGANLKATFLGNMPCGFYKFKFPRDIRSESFVGAKVFFFRALLVGGAADGAEGGDRVWVRRSELPDFLPPNYLKQVQRFIMDL